MRETMFRGKGIFNGEWFYGDLLKYEDERGKHLQIVTSNKGCRMHNHTVDPATVGQFTGLLDKNDVEIYEGDIVKGVAIASEGGFNYLGKVVFYNQSNVHGYFVEDAAGGAWRIEQLQKQISLDNITFLAGEVIGNIHDNPDALEGSDADES